jgi:hypothetical protein
MNIRYRVELKEEERAQFTAMLSGGKHAVRKLKRAQILLAAALRRHQCSLRSDQAGLPWRAAGASTQSPDRALCGGRGELDAYQASAIAADHYGWLRPRAVGDNPPRRLARGGHYTKVLECAPSWPRHERAACWYVRCILNGGRSDVGRRHVSDVPQPSVPV